MVGTTSTLPIRLEQVAFDDRGRSLLGPLDLTLNGGRCTVIMGPNGAGKSLLLRLCHGLLSPTRGTIRCGDAGSPTDTRVRRCQAMVLQRPVMLRRSVRANVLYALRMHEVVGTEASTRAEAALSLVGLLDLAGRSARMLSGGEHQRLALARAWALKPEIMFLDEPTAALDPQAAEAVEAAITRFHAQGTGIVMTTHSLAQARRLGDDMIVMADGQVLEHAPVAGQ